MMKERNNVMSKFPQRISEFKANFFNKKKILCVSLYSNLLGLFS